MKKLFTAVAAALIIAATSSTTVSATRTLNEDLSTKESALEYFNTLRAEAGLSPVTKSEMPKSSMKTTRNTSSNGNTTTQIPTV